MSTRSTAAAGVMAMLLAGTATAQSAQDPGRTQSVGGGIQWAHPIESGYLSGTPGATGSWRMWFGRHLGVEGAFGWWRYTRREEMNYPAFDGPFGSTPARQGFYKVGLSTYAFALNVVGRVPIGRAAIIAGGGPGLYVETGRVDGVMNGVAEHQSNSGTHLGLQALTEVEVLVTKRLAVFGGVRLETRDVSAMYDSLCGYPTAGVRWVF